MKLKSIVVATDMTDNSLPALKTALNLSLESSATLYVIHVLEIPAMSGTLTAAHIPQEELRQGALLKLNQLVRDHCRRRPNIRTDVLVGSPAETIADFARQKEAGLIVVGTHGRRGLARVFLGSTAEHLLRRATGQVLVVKPPSPVSRLSGK